MSLTKRIDLNVGFMCNANCTFCYYHHSHTKKVPSFEELKNKLNLAKKLGMESVEFTGGEPTMRENIFELVAYARQIGFKRMCMISNGILFKDKTFVEKAEVSGLEEIKLSIHSSKAKIHNSMTGLNSFKHVMAGIKNLKRTNLKIKTNTIISSLNYKSLPETARFLTRIKPSRINLKLITPILDATRLNKKIIASYSEVMPYLHKAIDILGLKGYTPIVRYIPFCFMQGYERNVCNLYQVQYDSDEWDYVVKNRIEYGLLLSEFNKLLGYINMFRHGWVSDKDFVHRSVIESKLLRFTTKGKVCKTCKYDLICDGLWESYTKLYGYDELKPLPGKKITDPTYFIKSTR